MGYFEELGNKNFIGNVVVKFLGEYFTLRNPDSGLTVAPRYQGLVSSLVLNPTAIDPRRVSTTISNYSFKLVDKGEAITKLVKETGADLIKLPVEIWIGRTGVGLDFADYYKLPITNIKAISRQDNGYSVSTTEDADRMNRPVFNKTTRLNGAILASTTVFTCKDDISGFPASGFLKIGKELVSYSSKNNGTKQFLGIIRGEFSTIPIGYNENEPLFLAQQITANPLDLLLQILISGGGGGAYDLLDDGLAIDEALIDVAGIEALRDEFFGGLEFTLDFANIANALKFLETEILAPCNVRFTYSTNSKLTLAILDKAKFVDSIDVIDEDTISDFPRWEVNDNRIVNEIQIDWDYNTGLDSFNELNIYEDAASIAAYGRRAPLKFQFKGVKAALNGQAFIDNFAQNLFLRLGYPNPEITVKTQIDKSILNIADKTLLESSMIPTSNGTLVFSSELEVINRAINYITGDVSLKLAFTSFSGIRSCYIAPSDTLASVVSQSIVTVGAGRGLYWEVGYKVRLWDNVGGAYLPDSVNEIASITGDQITFVNPWTTALLTTHRLKFPDYDDASNSQKRYCFVGDNFTDFLDGKKRYSILT